MLTAAPAPSAVTSMPTNNLSLTPVNQPKIPVPVPSLLKGMTLEDIINRWSSDLDERVRDFTNLASEIKAWDSVLISNGDEISKLYNSLQALDPVSTTIGESLDYVENEQKHMSSILDDYENQLDAFLEGRQGQNGSGVMGQMGTANSERERTYQLAESLNNQMDDLSRSLTSLINEVNSLSSSSGLLPSDSSDGMMAGQQNPVTAIAAILNAHLSSLSWIEKMGDTLADQVAEIEGRMKTASGEKWQGLSSSTSLSRTSPTPNVQRGGGGGTPILRNLAGNGSLTRSAYGGMTGSVRTNVTPSRAGFSGQISANGRAGTPIRLGQSSLGKSGVFGSGTRR